MNKISLKKSLFLLLISAFSLATAEAQNELKLWYKEPAVNWGEALPLGNGRIHRFIVI